MEGYGLGIEGVGFASLLAPGLIAGPFPLCFGIGLQVRSGQPLTGRSG